MSQIGGYDQSYLDQGWLFEENLICYKSNSYNEVKHSKDIVTDLIDQERRNFFLESNNIYQNQYIISFTYKAPKRNLDSFKSKVYVLEDIKQADQETLINKQFINKFKEEVYVVIDLLRADGITTQRLKDKYLYQFLKNLVNCTNQAVQEFDYKCFASRLFLDESLAQSAIKTDSSLQVNENHVKCISLDDIPNNYYPTILNSLNVMRMNFRFSARFNYISQAQIQKIFKTKHTQWSFKLFGSVKNFLTSLFKSPSEPIQEDAHAREMITDIELAQIREKYGAKFGYMTLTLVVWDQNKELLNEKITELKNILRQESFTPRVESINATNSYFGSLVGHGSYNCRANPVELELFVNMMATMGIYQGCQYSTCSHFTKESPALIECMTSNGYRKFYFNLHDKDKPHSIIQGPVGSGKTMLLANIAASWIKKYQDTRIIGADYQYSMLGITTSLNGKYVDVSDKDVQLAPFLDVDDEKYTKEFLNPWLKDIYKRNNKGIEFGKDENKAISQAVKSLTYFDKKDRTLERFIAQIEDELTQAVFQQFRNDLPYNILSGNTDECFESNFNIFNKESILKMHSSHRYPLLDFIYYKQIQAIEKASYELGKVLPFLMLIDEASFEFKDQYMRAKMHEYLKMVRHRGGGIIFTIQSARDIVGTGTQEESSIIYDNISTQIFLPNIAAKANDRVNEQYRSLGLSDLETQIITNALPNRDYYIKQRSGNKLVNIELGKLALAFFDLTIKNKKDLEYMKNLKLSDPQGWAYKWLEYRNVL